MKIDIKKERLPKDILSMSDWGIAMSRYTRPKLQFSGHTREDYLFWRKLFEAKYRELLVPFPKKVPLRAKVLDRRTFRTYIREKVIFASERFMSVPAWVCIPTARKRGQRLPAVIHCHGHGKGKDGSVGVDQKGNPTYMNHLKNLSVRLAEAGYVAIAPDWRVFGERAETPEKDPSPRDICNLANLITELFGYNLLSLNVWDGIRTIDYLATRQDVDISRIGCVGCSFGGTMTTFLSAADKRITAACISGYLTSTKKCFFWSGCGSQTLPGLLRWGDRAEVAGLICPRPLLIQVGQYDSTFPAEGALKEYRRLRKIYRAAGVEDRIDLDLFEGCHELRVPSIIQWFDRWLKK